MLTMKLLASLVLLTNLALGGLYIVNPTELRTRYGAGGELKSKLTNVGLQSN